MLVNHSIPLSLVSTSVRDPKQMPRGRYFTFLNETDSALCQKELYIAGRKIDKLTFVEIKCTFGKDWNFSLPNMQPTFWMTFQLLGTSSLCDVQKSDLVPQQYNGYFNTDQTASYQVRSGKVWMILIGMEINNREELTSEWKTLLTEKEEGLNCLPCVKIGFRNKKILDKIQLIKETPFSLSYKLQYAVIQLMETYHGDLLEFSKSIQQEDVSLFHRAKEYILHHYMDENIDIKQMAQELLTSDRTLYRIFKENGLTVNSAIQTIRIYKGREMVRRTDESVDMIAFHLQFSTAKYFIKQYVKYFGRTPAMERKLRPAAALSGFRSTVDKDDEA